MAKKFELYIANMGIIIKNQIMKNYHFIDIVKHYYKSL